jgi:hypothetical protein
MHMLIWHCVTINIVELDDYAPIAAILRPFLHQDPFKAKQEELN